MPIFEWPSQDISIPDVPWNEGTRRLHVRSTCITLLRSLIRMSLKWHGRSLLMSQDSLCLLKASQNQIHLEMRGSNGIHMQHMCIAFFDTLNHKAPSRHCRLLLACLVSRRHDKASRNRRLLLMRGANRLHVRCTRTINPTFRRNISDDST